MKDKEFETIMTRQEIEAWIAFEEVFSKFLGNYNNLDYKSVIWNGLDKFQALDNLISDKIHFLPSYLNFANSIKQFKIMHSNLSYMNKLKPHKKS